MALITFTSASGSPGVTSTVLAAAMAWPRPVLVVEADPTGGSGILAGYFRGQKDPNDLVELVMANRSGVMAEALRRLAVPIEGSDVSVLVGAKSHDQAAGLSRLWDPLLDALTNVAAAGQDVLVDAGRLGLEGWPRPLVRHSDLTLLVCRSTLPALAAARSWAQTLAEDVLPDHQVQVLLVGAGQPYGPREVSRVLDLPVLASVEWDQRRARVFSEGAAKPPARLGGEAGADRAFAASGYWRSVTEVGVAVQKALAGNGRDPLFRGIIAGFGETGVGA